MPECKSSRHNEVLDGSNEQLLPLKEILLYHNIKMHKDRTRRKKNNTLLKNIRTYTLWSKKKSLKQHYITAGIN